MNKKKKLKKELKEAWQELLNGEFKPIENLWQNCTANFHCWHLFTGMIHMVVPNGHILEKCCKCPATRTIHRDHSWNPNFRQFKPYSL